MNEEQPSGTAPPHRSQRGSSRKDASRRAKGRAGTGPPPTGAQEASNIVESLMRTKRAMKEDMERISNVSGAIDEDTRKIQDTQEQHKGLGGLAKGARGALRYLQAQETRETVVLWAAVLFFYLSALYVFWTRVRIPFFLW